MDITAISPYAMFTQLKLIHTAGLTSICSRLRTKMVKIGAVYKGKNEGKTSIQNDHKQCDVISHLCHNCICGSYYLSKPLYLSNSK